MSKREYVEFTGIMPKELAGAKKPIYGRVVKRSKSKGFLTVKPKHRSYEVTVDEADVTVVTYEKFHKKHKKKKSSSKKPATKKPVAAKKPASKVQKVVKEAKKVADSPVPAKKSAEKPVVPPTNGAIKKEDCPTKKEVTSKSGNVKVEGKGPVKVEQKPGTHPPFSETVKEKIAEGEAKVDQPDKKPFTPKSEPVAKKIQKDEQVMEKVAGPKIDPEMDAYLEEQKGGGVIVYVVIGLLAAAAVGAYFLFF